jgi:hypothetical protein
LSNRRTVPVSHILSPENEPLAGLSRPSTPFPVRLALEDVDGRVRPGQGDFFLSEVE